MSFQRSDRELAVVSSRLNLVPPPLSPSAGHKHRHKRHKVKRRAAPGVAVAPVVGGGGAFAELESLSAELESLSLFGSQRGTAAGPSNGSSADSGPHRRSKRFLSYPRFVEVMLVADSKMVEHHGSNLQHYILTLMSIVSAAPPTAARPLPPFLVHCLNSTLDRGVSRGCTLREKEVLLGSWQTTRKWSKSMPCRKYFVCIHKFSHGRKNPSKSGCAGISPLRDPKYSWNFSKICRGNPDAVFLRVK